MKKRIISLLLALIMALSLLPVSVLAVESSAEPTISADLPAELALQPGDNFTLTVTALGSGTLSYQWYANTVSDYAGGTKIKGAESATYDVATAVEQVLYYYVEVTNTEEGKGPATVRSAICKVTVSESGSGELSDIPEITKDVVDAEDVVLPWDSLKSRKFSVSVKELGMTQLSYQWYRNTNRSYDGAELIPDATKESYSILGTTVLGTSYYFCVVTNTLADGSTKTTRSAIGSLTIKAPEEMLYGIVVGEEPVGRVEIRVQDTVPARTDLVNGLGEAIADPGPYGDLVGGQSAGVALIYPSDTMMTIIARALLEDGHRQVGGEKGYISSIIANYGTENSVELSEFRRGKGSGWMGTLNDWCTNQGFDKYSVAKGDIKDGDYINVMYTTDYGNDINCGFDATDASLASMTLWFSDTQQPDNFNMKMELSSFSSDTEHYEIMMPQNTAKVEMCTELVQKQFKGRLFVGDKEYRLGYQSSEAIPFVGDTMTITIKTAVPATSTAAETEGKTYTFTLLRDRKLLTKDGDVTVDLLRKDGTVAQEGYVPKFVTATQSWTFSGGLPAYTADEDKNITGVVLHLPNLPEGVTAEVVAPSGTRYTVENGTAKLQGETLRYGTFNFTLRLTQDGQVNTYLLQLTKQAATTGLKTCAFDGANQSYNPENIYNGQPEGTMLRVGPDGKETGETGFDTNWYEYDIHVTEKIQSLRAKKRTDIMLMGARGGKVTITVNNTPVFGPKDTPTMGIGMWLANKAHYIALDGKTTDFSIRIENAKDSTDVVTYTFHIIRHSIEATELETMIQALPEMKYFVYSEHEGAVRQAKKIYDECKDEVKAQLSDGAKIKLEALWAELERQYQAGMDLANAVLAEVNKYKADIPKTTAALTDELYAKYADTIRTSGKLYEKLQGWALTLWTSTAPQENSVLQNALKLLNKYETGKGSTIGQATDYLDDFMLTASGFNLTLGSAWNAYPVTFKDIIYSQFAHPEAGGEAGVPWNYAGRLRFEIDDPSIFEIREVKSFYADKGLGSNGEVYENILYYLIPLKEGTTTFRVTLTDEVGVYYGQTPETIVHVNSPAEAAVEKLDQKLTNIKSLPRTSQYDIHYYWQGQEGAPFTFKVNGENAKVYVWDYLGGGKKTAYPVAADGTVTVLLKDGYNPIEVTADYEGKTVTQVYGLKGKVIDYTLSNVTRPGQEPRLGDTVDLKITGLSVPVYKILRIYNPMGPQFIYYTEDLPQQYRLQGNNDQYHIGSMRIVLTGSGTINLTGGHIFEAWMGSKLGSELTQGNTGEIAPQQDYVFSVLPDLSFTVADYDGYTGQAWINTEVEGGPVTKAGKTVTINIPNIPLDEIAKNYPSVTTSTITKLQTVLTIFGTNIPGLETVESKTVQNPLSGKDANLTPITSITFTVPADTPAGTYKIYGGYVKLRCGDPNWSIATKYLYERQIRDVELTVLPEVDYSGIYKTTGDFIQGLGTPTVNSIGGEWMTIGLARSGRPVPAGYYDNVVKFVRENADKNERLDRNKVTENARVILALTAIGKDVTNVDGHNLLKGLDSMSYIKTQGINGPIFTLIALDSHNYPTSGDVTREKLIETILGAALEDGGWTLSGTKADPDMTAMAIQALAPYYKTNETVKAAVDKALDVLSGLQQGDGGFGSWGTVNSESCAQVIVALTALGLDPTCDSRFVKNGKTPLDALAGFFVDGGGFKHVADKGRDGMATEQGYYALASYYRFLNGQTSLYDMSDVTVQTGGTSGGDNSGNGTNNGGTPATGDTGVLVWVIALPVAALAAAFVLKRKEREA